MKQFNCNIGKKIIASQNEALDLKKLYGFYKEKKIIHSPFDVPSFRMELIYVPDQP